MKNGQRRAVALGKLRLRCYAEREGDQWVAVCIDLNLAAQADSFAEAKKRLHNQIQWFVYDAVEGDDREHGAELLFRKAPLALVARYHFVDLMSRVEQLRDHFRSFADILPLGPSRPAAA